MFNRKYIFRTSMFHCYASLPECIPGTGYTTFSGCSGGASFPSFFCRREGTRHNIMKNKKVFVDFVKLNGANLLHATSGCFTFTIGWPS